MTAFHSLAPCAAPTIRTDRVTLRPMLVDDWPGYRDHLMSDRFPAAFRATCENQAWARFLAEGGGWEVVGAGTLSVDFEDDLAGFVSLRVQPDFPELQLGCHLLPHATGYRLANEAAAPLRDWARDVAGAPSLVAYIAPENAPAIACMSGLGAVEDPAANGPDGTAYKVFRFWGPMGGPAATPPSAAASAAARTDGAQPVAGHP